MLNFKKLLTKLMTAPSFVASFNWSGSYTPAYNGIMLMRVQRASTAGTVTFYVKDTTANEYGVGALSTGTISANYQNSICFPVIKGHKYETEYSDGVANVTCRFYKVPSWGGYSLKALFHHLAERRWEYAEHKESPYEDSHLYGRADESSSRRYLHNINSSESRNMEECIGNNSIGVHSALLQDIWCKPRLDKHYKYIDIRCRQHFDNRLFLPEYHKRSNKLFSWWRCNPGENIVAYSNTSGRGCSYA